VSPGLYDAAVMHDFFVDRLVRPRGFRWLFGVADEKARQGGGSVHGVSQQDVRGGNAVNLAHALATLGAKVLLITHSDAEHSGMLRKSFDGLRAEVRIKPLPPGLTVSLEGSVNVMLSDSGGAASFPPSLLTEQDWDSLRRSRIVCCVNWAANRKGTELLGALRSKLGQRKTLFLNPSDVRDRYGDYRALLGRMRERRVVDWVSMNEYEAASTSRALGLGNLGPRRACLEIARALKARVDVHTEDAVYTSLGSGVTSVATRRVKPKRLTGAGDVWDAASIAAFLRGMGDRDRLEFANAAARLFVKSGGPVPPTLAEVRSALR